MKKGEYFKSIGSLIAAVSVNVGGCKEVMQILSTRDI